MRVCAPTVLPACEFSRVFVRQGVGVEERNNGLLGNVTNRRSRPRRDASRDFTTTGRRRRRRRGKERERERPKKSGRETKPGIERGGAEQRRRKTGCEATKNTYKMSPRYLLRYTALPCFIRVCTRGSTHVSSLLGFPYYFLARNRGVRFATHIYLLLCSLRYGFNFPTPIFLRGRIFLPLGNC